MIEKMTRYSFIVTDKYEEQFLSDIEQIGLVDITRSVKPVDETSSAMLAGAEALRRRIEDIKAGRYSRDALYNSLSASLDAVRKQMAQCGIWGEYDSARVGALQEQGLKMRFYIVPVKKFDPSWGELYPLQEVHRDAKKVYFVTVGPLEDYSFPLQQTNAPQASIKELEESCRTLEEQLSDRKKFLDAEANLIPALQEEYAAATSDLEKYLARAGSEDAAEGRLCVIEGFAPTDKDDVMAERLDALEAVWLRDKALVEENPPIKLRNNGFVSMFELFTDMYGRPAYNGFDPTPYIAVFFMLFFAFCMGDCGYGLILTAAGLMLKKKMGKIAPLVTTLGIATVVVGFIFHTFFSIDISQWEWIQSLGLDKVMLPSQIMGYDGTMVLAIIVGIVHLSLAMIVKTYYATRNNGLFYSLGTWGWTLLIVGGFAVGAFALLGVLDKSTTKLIIIILGAVSAIGIFLLNNPRRNPLINIGTGLWDTYNAVTGLLGDVLSYLRLYALGLAGAMLGKAFNDIAMMLLGDGHNAVMWVPFVLVLLVGHTLNLLMCILGAFVHPLRLNFLEFFKNSAYEPAGRNYKPLKK